MRQFKCAKRFQDHFKKKIKCLYKYWLFSLISNENETFYLRPSISNTFCVIEKTNLQLTKWLFNAEITCSDFVYRIDLGDFCNDTLNAPSHLNTYIYIVCVLENWISFLICHVCHLKIRQSIPNLSSTNCTEKIFGRKEQIGTR